MGAKSTLYKIIRNITTLLECKFDSRSLAQDIPAPSFVGHSMWCEYLSSKFNKSGVRILEIGSREVTGPSLAKNFFQNAEYTGFDYYEGPNVDIVGDAHMLSSYFSQNEQFDLIYSAAVFEHLAMPWVVAAEISKLLRIGGYTFTETHFSYSSHERPWHFFQYSDMGLKALFSPALGFECCDAGMSNPIIGRFSALADEYLRYQPVDGLYCHSEYLGKKIAEPENYTWTTPKLSTVVGETCVYPQRNK